MLFNIFGEPEYKFDPQCLYWRRATEVVGLGLFQRPPVAQKG